MYTNRSGKATQINCGKHASAFQSKSLVPRAALRLVHVSAIYQYSANKIHVLHINPSQLTLQFQTKVSISYQKKERRSLFNGVAALSPQHSL